MFKRRRKKLPYGKIQCNLYFPYELKRKLYEIIGKEPTPSDLLQPYLPSDLHQNLIYLKSLYPSTYICDFIQMALVLLLLPSDYPTSQVKFLSEKIKEVVNSILKKRSISSITVAATSVLVNEFLDPSVSNKKALMRSLFQLIKKFLN
jgi:hypothetical protein